MNYNIDLDFAFAPIYIVVNKLVGIHKSPCVKIKSDSSLACRIVAPIANVAKKALICLAIGLSVIATAIFSVFSLPYRCISLYETYKASNKFDLNMLTPAEKTSIKAEITRYVEKHGGQLTSSQKKEYIYTIMVSYARSSKVYGPVLRNWAEYLLEKANKDNKKLVFMARDGIPAYKMAVKLMAKPEFQQKYPNLTGDKQIVLGHISRKNMAFSQSSKEKEKLFQEYASNELGIAKDSDCLFVDIGFSGSTIDKIRGMLPEAKINFEYLISMTDKAKGYIANEDMPLNSIPHSGWNAGVYWLENTHQGTLESSTEFVKVNDRVYPNNLVPNNKKFCAKKGSLEFMIRRFSQKAVVRCHNEPFLNPTSFKNAVRLFDKVIDKVNLCSKPWFIRHK